MIKIAKIGFVAVSLFGTMLMSCRKAENKVEEVLQPRDTLSYIIGLNVGNSLLKMDPKLNIESVCEAIRDVYNGAPKMTMEDAREYYLAEKTYFVHERAKTHQEQFLLDLSKNNRQYVRTRTGVTYRILELGDQSYVGTMSARDTVKMVCTIVNESGKEVAKADTLRDSYRNILKGLQEVVKLAGDGAHFNAWIPSSMGYGSEGNKELGIGPNELLNYDVQILEIKYVNNKNKKK